MNRFVQWIAQIFPIYWLGLGTRSALLPDSMAGVEIGDSWRHLETVGVFGIWAVVGLALETLAVEGFEARVEDIERLSSLRHEHVNLLGRYQFTLADDLLQGGLRPLCRPSILEDY